MISWGVILFETGVSLLIYYFLLVFLWGNYAEISQYLFILP